MTSPSAPIVTIPKHPLRIGVALGDGFREDVIRQGTHQYPLTLSSRLNALVAGDLYLDDEISLVVISGGKTAGSSHPSEAAAMKAYLKKVFGEHIQDNHILLDETARSTYEHVAGVRTSMRDILHTEIRINLITTAAHCARAEEIFKRQGMPPDSVTESDIYVEGITELSCRDTPVNERIVQNLQRRARTLSRYQTSSAALHRMKRESILRLLDTMDYNGTVASVLRGWQISQREKKLQQARPWNCVGFGKHEKR